MHLVVFENVASPAQLPVKSILEVPVARAKSNKTNRLIVQTNEVSRASAPAYAHQHACGAVASSTDL